MKSIIFILLYFASTAQGQMEGGVNAHDGEFPFMVQVWSDHVSRINAICAGAILTENWVITAAHCVADDRTGVPFNDVHVVAGNRHQGIQHRIDNAPRGRGYWQDEYTPNRIIPYTPFDRNTRDIALLYFLRQTLPVGGPGAPVQAIQMEGTRKADREGTRCKIAGWGAERWRDQSWIDQV